MALGVEGGRSLDSDTGNRNTICRSCLSAAVKVCLQTLSEPQSPFENEVSWKLIEKRRMNTVLKIDDNTIYTYSCRSDSSR